MSIRRLILPAAGVLVLVVAVVPSLWDPIAGFLFPGEAEPVYGRASMLRLVGEHLLLVGVSAAAALVAGLAIGIGVTRPAGRRFLPLAQDVSSLAQTLPPVAVLALAVPLLGFGFEPTVLALFLYSILPIIKNTIAGISGIDPVVLEAADGMGMSLAGRLWSVELPLALPVILAGARTSIVINVGTATIGSTIGAGGLGRIIVAGLVRDNYAWTFTGALTAAVLALLLDWGLSLPASRASRGDPAPR